MTINRICDLVLSTNKDSFSENLNKLFEENNFPPHTLWEVSKNICEAEGDITCDIFELGYTPNAKLISNIDKEIAYFDRTIYVASSIFLEYRGRVYNAITFSKELTELQKQIIENIQKHIALRVYEITAQNSRMDLYIDYQKKVDFIKKASAIFKVLNMKELIPVIISFFNDTFSGETVFCIYEGKFHSLGLAEEDIYKNIFLNGAPLAEFVSILSESVFIENEIESDKYNIKNAFFIYEPTSDIKIVIFNIMIDIIPDKDFSSLIASIVSIAIENSKTHKAMLQFKTEEAEIKTTSNILTKFVNKEIEFKDDNNFYAISYPAKVAGGDFTFAEKVGDEYFFCVADVCGKGYSAAVLTVVMSVFTSNIFIHQSLPDGIKRINSFLINKNFADRFITAFFGKYNTKTRKLSYLSCGHDPVAIITKDEDIFLNAKFVPLGLMEEDYEESEVLVPEKSTIFVYTDGLTEYASLEELVAKVQIMEDMPLKDMMNSLYDELVLDKHNQRDDWTNLILKTD